MDELLIWTVLPNGVVVDGARRSWRLSVHVGARLDSGHGTAPLGDFEMRRFPDRSFDLALRITGPDGVGHELPLVADRRPGIPAAPDAAMWARLFPNSLPVNAPTRSTLHRRTIRSYSAENARLMVRRAVAEVARSSPGTPPSVSDLDDFEGGNAVTPFLTIGNEQIRDQFEAAVNRGSWSGTDTGTGRALPHLPIDDNFSAGLNVVQHQAFLEPRNGLRYIRTDETAKIPAPIERPAFDFHSALSVVGNHPDLLRRVGLVRDFVVDLSALPWVATGPSDALVELVVAPASPFRSTTPATQCQVSTVAFLPAGDGSEAEDGFIPGADGMLPLEDADRFHPIEVDADGAVLKLVAFRDELRMRQFTSDQPDAPAAMPALRSFGLSVAERNRAVALLRRFRLKADRDADLASGAPVTLYLEDLTRGMRLDVWDATAGRWFSLLRRHGRYVVGRDGDATTFETDDEGWISPAPTEGGGPAATPDLYLQETLALWSGWSLAAPQPGAPLDADGQPAAPPGNPANSNIALAASFRAAPGTLPRLRYGREYRFRARTVDLVGNDVGFGEPTVLGPHVTPPVRYRRFEPVAAPVVLPREPLTSGETVDRMVIRSDIDTAVDTPNERHLAPPRTSQQMAEQHGMFDTAGGLSAAAYATIVERDRFGFDSSDQGRADPGTPDQRFFDVDLLEVGYLPDPLAVGVVFTGLPGASGRTVVSFVDPGAPWPARRPLRLRFVEGMTAPRLLTEGGAQVLEISGTKALTATARVASLIPADPATLDLLGLWGWLTEEHSNTAELQDTILSSGHWMVTPWRDLTFVHAVRRPLVAPPLAAQLQRTAGEGPPRDGTKAYLGIRVGFDPPSTQSLELMASWSDPVDPGLPQSELVLPPRTPNVDSVGSAVDDAGKPLRISHQARATTLALGDGGETTGIVVHDVGDVKHHVVDYSVVATTRFAEYFTETASIALSSGAVTVSPSGFAAGSVAVTLDTGLAVTTFVEGTDYTVDTAAGTIRRVDGGAITSGQVVEVRHVPAPVTRTGPTVRLDLPASAPPVRPSVLYVIPTFGWSTSGSGRFTKQSTRLGNGVRVYLDRPWWSSGDGELLGVQLWDRPVPAGGTLPLDVPEQMAKYVTQYGEDPISGQLARVTRGLRTRDFPRATVVRSGLRPLEFVDRPPDPDTTVAVAGHEVGFDAKRKLWYCDIDVSAGLSYFPFLRLALARFQPSANDGCHLSSTVLADFIQLAPDRKATIAFDPADPLSVRVSVTGLSLRSQVSGDGVPRSLPSSPMAEMRVTVERQEFPQAGDAGWTPVAGLTSIELTRLDLPFTASTTWSGALRLTSSRLSVPQRLVIEEFERRDEGIASPARVDVDGNRVDGRRLVYTDIIRL